MTLSERIEAFIALGQRIRSLPPEIREAIAAEACGRNSWFTPSMVAMALHGIERLLQEPELTSWAARYNLSDGPGKTIGVVMAGNIPMVGFHDYLCVLISGHRLKAKLSSRDDVLIPRIHQLLIEINPSFGSRASFAERVDRVDAVITTGSDNTARYFEYYFRTIPHVIRKNRSSLAVLTGRETSDELQKLGTDVFSYFGLGCRNISKILIPPGYDFAPLFEAWAGNESVMDHHKYGNNYNYQKTIFLLNRTPFLDTSYVLVKEDESLASPLAVLFYQPFKDPGEAGAMVRTQSEKIQCVVSAGAWLEGSIPFGQAQFPNVGDYADRIDTMSFLAGISDPKV